MSQDAELRLLFPDGIDFNDMRIVFNHHLQNKKSSLSSTSTQTLKEIKPIIANMSSQTIQIETFTASSQTLTTDMTTSSVQTFDTIQVSEGCQTNAIEVATSSSQTATTETKTTPSSNRGEGGGDRSPFPNNTRNNLRKSWSVMESQSSIDLLEKSPNKVGGGPGMLRRTSSQSSMNGPTTPGEHMALDYYRKSYQSPLTRQNSPLLSSPSHSVNNQSPLVASSIDHQSSTLPPPPPDGPMRAKIVGEMELARLESNFIAEKSSSIKDYKLLKKMKLEVLSFIYISFVTFFVTFVFHFKQIS